MDAIVIAALYQFKVVADAAVLQAELKVLCKEQGILGTLIVAPEGINGTVSGSRAAIDILHQYLLSVGFNHMEYKESFAPEHTFKRLKIKLKKKL